MFHLNFSETCMKQESIQRANASAKYVKSLIIRLRLEMFNLDLHVLIKIHSSHQFCTYSFNSEHLNPELWPCTVNRQCCCSTTFVITNDRTTHSCVYVCVWAREAEREMKSGEADIRGRGAECVRDDIKMFHLSKLNNQPSWLRY